MSKYTKIAKSILFVAVSVGAFTAMGFSNSSQSITITGQVPLNCRVAFNGGSGAFNPNGTADLGTSREFCNNADGYRVIARAEGVDKGASLIVDNRRYSITSGREFVIADSNSPAIKNRSISLDAGNGAGGGSLSLRIEAK